MAFSASTDFSYTRDQIINAALRKCRAYAAEGGDPEAYQTADAAEALNLRLKAVQTHGALLWTIREQEIPLAKGKRVYTIGPSGDVNTDRPLRIFNPRLRDITTNTDTPITPYGRLDYAGISDKFTTGTPTAVFYDRKVSLAELTVWPVPSDSKKRLIVTAEVPLQDFDASGDTAYMPSYAYTFLVWGLAADLGSEYGLPLPEIEYFENKAAIALENILDFEEEEDGFQIVPNYGSSY
jgi:hypothetical protein